LRRCIFSGAGHGWW